MDVEDVGRLDGDVCPTAQAGLGQCGVYGAGGEDRRDRQPVEADPAIDATGPDGPFVLGRLGVLGNGAFAATTGP